MAEKISVSVQILTTLNSEEVVGWSLVGFNGQSFFFSSSSYLVRGNGLFTSIHLALLVLIRCAAGLCVRVLFIVSLASSR